MMALDRVADARRQSPAPHHHRPHEGMINAELASLTTDALIGRDVQVVEFEVAIELRQYGSPDVVQQRRHRQLVAVWQSRQLRDPIGGADLKSTRLNSRHVK